MRFSKWHALGNSYLVVERADAGLLEAQVVRRLCDGHVGVGSDGVLEVVAVSETTAEVVVWNPDGSRAELSGNGTRIAACWLARRVGASEVVVAVGAREVRAHVGAKLTETEVGPVEVGETERIDVEGEPVEVVPVSVGNPHAVLVREPQRDELLRLGPRIERHPRFAGGTNVQLARYDGGGRATALVWERGAGETPSSGTSAVAVAAAGIALGRAASPVVVSMPGGDLRVAVDAAWRATLTGPAQEICRGEIAPHFFDAS